MPAIVTALPLFVIVLSPPVVAAVNLISLFSEPEMFAEPAAPCAPVVPVAP